MIGADLDARLNETPAWEEHDPVFDVTDERGVQATLLYDEPTDAGYVQITAGAAGENCDLDWNACDLTFLHLSLDDATELAAKILNLVVIARTR